MEKIYKHYLVDHANKYISDSPNYFQPWKFGRMKNPLGEPAGPEEMVGSSTMVPGSPKLREVLQGARANWQNAAQKIGQENLQ